MMAPIPAPTPIPAWAAVDNPAGVSVEVGTLDSSVDGSFVMVVVASAVRDVDVSVVVAASLVDFGFPSYMVPTTIYRVDCRFHVAHTSGSDGRTLNLPTPLLQQLALWSQQYDVSVFVTLEQDIKSVPPVSAPRQNEAQPVDDQFSSVQDPRTVFPLDPKHNLFDMQTEPNPPPQQALSLASGSQG